MLQLLKWRIWTDLYILSLKSKYVINICFELQQDTKIVLRNNIAESVWRFLWPDSDIIIIFFPERQRALPFKLRPWVTLGSWPNPDRGLESLCPDYYLFCDVFLKTHICIFNSNWLKKYPPLFWFCTLVKRGHQESRTLGTSEKEKEYSQTQPQTAICRIKM